MEPVCRLQAVPFVPGLARGRLQIGLETAGPDGISVLTQEELGRLAARPAGLIVIDGAPFSHPMLRVLGLEIPTVILDGAQAARLPAGAEALVDGADGLIVVPPPPQGLGQRPIPQAPQPGGPVLSADGAAVELRASVSGVAAAAAACRHGAAAIGLVRSEYLIPPSGALPDAAFYQDAFRAICQAAAPLTVTIRLLDVAGDKRPPWLEEIPGRGGVLGLQGARLYRYEPVRGVFLAQVEGAGRAAVRHPLRLLIPYLTALEEAEHWRQEIEGHLGRALPLGAMVETPAAALAIRDWLEVVDFVALGTNDLMQCLFAADRDLPEVRPFLDPYAPVLYRLLRQIAEAAGGRLAEVQVCGLLAQLPGVLPVLLGLGYRIFSVEPVMIPWLAEAVRRTDTATAAELAARVCGAARSAPVRDLLGAPPAALRRGT